MEYYLAIKKEWNLAIFKTWMDLEGIVLSEISQRKTNMWNLKKQSKWLNITKQEQSQI